MTTTYVATTLQGQQIGTGTDLTSVVQAAAAVAFTFFIASGTTHDLYVRIGTTAQKLTAWC